MSDFFFETDLIIHFIRLDVAFWVSVGILYLNFTYVFLERTKTLTLRIFQGLTLIVFLLTAATPLTIEGIEYGLWGAEGTPGPLFFGAFLLWTVPVFVAIYFLTRAWRSATDWVRKRQIQIVLIGAAVGFILAFLLDIVVRNGIGVEWLPPMVPIGALIQSVSVFFAITRYRFLAIRLEDAAAEVFANVQDGVVVVNERGAVVLSNDAAARILGQPTSKLVGSSLTEYLDYDPENDFEDLEMTVGKYILDVSQATLEELGKVLGKIVILHDITAQKLAERELREINHELDQFAHVVSHDLKAPLRAVDNLSEWIAEDLGDKLDGESAENMDLLRQRVGRMQNLIEGILNYSRVGREAEETMVVDLNLLMPDVLGMLAVPDTFEVVIQEDLPEIEANRTRLQQVFANLVGNAIKYHDRKDGKVEVRTKRVGDFHRFEVADDGPGIAPKDHEKVFGVFATLKARDDVESTGVGLAIVKKVIEGAGGEVGLESDLGEGATFWFTWPALE